MTVSLGLCLGGGLANETFRTLVGPVPNYISLSALPGQAGKICNLADAGIYVSVPLMTAALALFMFDVRRRRSELAAAL